MTRWRSWFFCCAAFLMSMCQMGCGPNERCVSDPEHKLNGSFEVFQDGYPVNWAFAPNPEKQPGIRVEMDTSVRVHGNHSLRVELEREEPVCAFRSRAVAMNPSEPCRVSFRVRAAGAKIRVNRIILDGTGKTVLRRDIILFPVETGKWSHVEETVVPQSGEKKIVLIFLAAGPGTVWCDDVRIQSEPDRTVRRVIDCPGHDIPVLIRDMQYGNCHAVENQ